MRNPRITLFFAMVFLGGWLTSIQDSIASRGNGMARVVQGTDEVIRILVYPPVGTTRVDFYIDDVKVAEDRTYPFSATVYSRKLLNGRHVVRGEYWVSRSRRPVVFAAGDGTTSDFFELNVFHSLLSAGRNHTCAVRSARAYCWGSNEHGQLGNKAGVFANTAVPALGLINVSQVAAGAEHTCALAGGAVYCWGRNHFGQLGIGAATSRDFYLPQPVIGLYSGVVAIAAGGGHTCAIIETGEVKCWGDNSRGQLGVGSLNASPYPVFVRYLPYFAEALSLGDAHTCAVVNATPAVQTSYGRLVVCWGDHQYGQLGIGAGVTLSFFPSRVVFNSSDPAPFAIAAGAKHSCAQLADGSLKCWGKNFGSDPASVNADHAWTPREVTYGDELAPQPGGVHHICGLASDLSSPWGGSDEIFCWGSNVDGQLGIDDALGVPTPSVPVRLNGIISVTQGSRHSCAASLTQVFCWGANDLGQLGNGGTGDSWQATLVEF